MLHCLKIIIVIVSGDKSDITFKILHITRIIIIFIQLQQALKMKYYQNTTRFSCIYLDDMRLTELHVFPFKLKMRE